MGRVIDDGELAEVASQLAASLRAGAPLPSALAEVRAVGPVARDLDRVVELHRRGVPVVEALALWRQRRGDEGIDLVVAACGFGHRHGGAPARALEGAAATLRDRAELADEVRALTSQARAGVAVLAALPVVGAAGFALLDPGVADVLVGTPVGWLCLGVGALLDGAGLLLARRMVAGALR